MNLTLVNETNPDSLQTAFILVETLHVTAQNIRCCDYRHVASPLICMRASTQFHKSAEECSQGRKKGEAAE